MEIILTSNVGKVVQYSLQRRLLVWIGLNLLFSCTVYVAFAIAAAYLFPKDFAGLSFLRFSLYCSCHIGLAFVVYCQYSSDGKKFGALGIREFPIQQTLKTAILAIAGAVCYGKIIADTFLVPSCLKYPQYSVNIGHVFTFTNDRHLVPVLACFLTFWWFLRRGVHSCGTSGKDSHMQLLPQPILVTYCSLLENSVIISARKSLWFSSTLALIMCLLRGISTLLSYVICANSSVSDACSDGFAQFCINSIDISADGVPAKYAEETEPAAAAASTVISVFATRITHLSCLLDRLLPASAIGSDFLASASICILLLGHLLVFHYTLSFFFTYPLDFRKLQQQHSKRDTRRISSNEPSYDLLLEALLLGCAYVTPKNLQSIGATTRSIASGRGIHGGTKTTGGGGGGAGSLLQLHGNYEETNTQQDLQDMQTRQSMLRKSIVYEQTSIGDSGGDGHLLSSAFKHAHSPYCPPPIVPYFGEKTPSASLFERLQLARQSPPPQQQRASTMMLMGTGGGFDQSRSNRSANSSSSSHSNSGGGARKELGKMDLLARNLAMQDLNRAVRCLSSRGSIGQSGGDGAGMYLCRELLYRRPDLWHQVVTSALTAIDAMTLQVQLVNDYLTTAPPNNNNNSSSNKSKTINAVTSTSSASRAQSTEVTATGTSAASKNTTTTTTTTAAPGSTQASADAFNRILHIRSSLSSAQIAPDADAMAQAYHAGKTVEIESKSKVTARLQQQQSRRYASVSNMLATMLSSVLRPLAEIPRRTQATIDQYHVLRRLQQVALVYIYSSLRLPVAGYGAKFAGTLATDAAFPPMAVSSVLLSIESISLLQTYALVEDSSGLTHRSVHSVLRTLLQLERTLSTYCTTLQTSPAAVYLSAAVNSHHHQQQRKVRYRVQDDSLVPRAVRSLQVAVQEAIYRIVVAYRDVLVLLVANYSTNTAAQTLYSASLMEALQAKLSQI